jgi:5-methyltetrahydrofolate--homocysteine methyltransferase
VKGDLHDIGKNLVSMMLEGAGFKVVDLGVDVDTDKFLGAARESGADIVAMSALLTTTMPAMEATVATIKEKGLGLKTMVGGAPVTEPFAQKIGAAGYSEDGPTAVALARRLLAA